MQQLAFDLAYEPELTKANFIISYCNFEAYTMVTNPVEWPDNRLLIIGPEGSGKSHLARIFTDDQVDLLLDSEIQGIELKGRKLVVENIEHFHDEQKLFHILNLAKEFSIKLLLTASALAKYQLQDLQSRINATSKIIIKRPDDSLLKALLLKHFSERQLVISSTVMEYIFTRAERNFKYIKQLVGHIDQISLEKKREITIPLVKMILEKNMPHNVLEEISSPFHNT